MYLTAPRATTTTVFFVELSSNLRSEKSFLVDHVSFWTRDNSCYCSLWFSVLKLVQWPWKSHAAETAATFKLIKHHDFTIVLKYWEEQLWFGLKWRPMLRSPSTKSAANAAKQNCEKTWLFSYFTHYSVVSLLRSTTIKVWPRPLALPKQLLKSFWVWVKWALITWHSSCITNGQLPFLSFAQS